eukprot:jgi/Ulvmu1/6611/UM003_0248.1
MPLSTAEDLAKAHSVLLDMGSKALHHPKPMLAYLRLLRELGVPNFEATVEYGTALLSRYPRHMSQDERWQLHEEVAIAALSCGRPGIAEKLIGALDKRFPGSKRVLCLRGMAFEAVGDFDGAESLYDTALEAKATFAEAMKRKIGLHTTTGDLPKAIAAATEYLATYQTDATAWDQLHRLYIRTGQLAQAQYCLEELLLHMPGSANTLINLADVLYAQGGLPNLKAAFAYYSRVLELTIGQNTRALYGAAATHAAVSGLVADGAATDLPDLARQQLVALYEQHAPEKVTLVQSLVAAQQ